MTGDSAVFALDVYLGWESRHFMEHGEGGLREGGEGLERTAPNCMHSEWFQGKTQHFGLNVKKNFNPTDPGWG